MKIIVLKDQIHLAKEKTEKLIVDIPFEKWNETPEIIKSNINWQIGHIILANYLHGVASISGADSEFSKKVKDYIKFYGPKSNPCDFQSEKPSAKELLDAFQFTCSATFRNLKSIDTIDLDKITEVPNPSAKTKYQALKLLSQHQSWHNGQIAILKRILNI
ncbi:DinB family protein [Pseudofulvibacter geojedonensis]|uniref:DinB family protein n=1 Tax=Pseudofulvibacter geojedonensis TaxID=1123758 RepID=A0ABW3I313_9FLAO